MAWNPREWKRTGENLQDKYRLWVEEFFSTIASEEKRLARMETDGQLESIATNQNPKDTDQSRGDISS